MSALELRIPPPFVAIIFIAAIWVISLFTPAIGVARLVRILVAGPIAVLGGCFALAGFYAFHRAKTTIDPMKPNLASSLVTGGIYRVTRNPMYAGLLLAQVALVVFLGAPWAFAVPLAFILYITRFQIAPEERALAALFGESYAHYKARVRRWF